MIYTFLDELKRCDYTLFNNSTIIEDFKYNGVTYAEGSETYDKLLNNMFTSFKRMAIEKPKSAQLAILHELKEVSETYYDIPTWEAITQLENDYSRQLNKDKSILFSIRQGKFIKEMNDRQKDYTQKAIAFLKSITTETGIEDKKPTAEQPKEKAKEWLTLDEVVAHYNLPKNNIKSRQWRISNNFPKGNDKAYGSLIFSATEVEKWLNERKC